MLMNVRYVVIAVAAGIALVVVFLGSHSGNTTIIATAVNPDMVATYPPPHQQPAQQYGFSEHAPGTESKITVSKDSSRVPRSILGLKRPSANPDPVVSYGHTTGPGIPGRIREILSKYADIDDNATTSYGSEVAVKLMEKRCGWNESSSNFVDRTAIDEIGFDASASDFLKLLESDRAYDDMDIVIPSIRDLDFLELWKGHFFGYHIILIQDGDPSKKLKVPAWADFELYNRHDIKHTLGEDQWIISSRDASIRNFGFLVSKKKFVYTIDDDCNPVMDANGKPENVILKHLNNLRRPSTPYFFNTLYDPYVEGSDFVRGYPYSLRGGVPTAISHGLWLNAPDYDAPTQLLKVTERNQRKFDTAITIPAGVLYPMCSMNVAFDRTLVGPAFMQGLMGDGQPWARYDDMFAGWASKVVTDHLGLGTKSGAPYIKHNKASNPFTNLRKEYKGLFWQETVIDFMNGAALSKASDTPGKAYKELAGMIRAELTSLHEYFDRLATAMEKWVDAWDRREASELSLGPSRRSSFRFAVLTVVHRKESLTQLGSWCSHYQSQGFSSADLHVVVASFITIDEVEAVVPAHVVIERVTECSDSNCDILNIVNRQHAKMLGTGTPYRYVVFSLPDERVTVAASGDVKPPTLAAYLTHLRQPHVVAIAVVADDVDKAVTAAIAGRLQPHDKMGRVAISGVTHRMGTLDFVPTSNTTASSDYDDSPVEHVDKSVLIITSSREVETHQPVRSWTFRKPQSRSRYAVFTIVKNESLYLAMWLKHYVREFPREDIYVINNGGNDTIPAEFAGVNLVERRCEQYFDHRCIVDIVEAMLDTLLRDGYRYVVFSESDELIYVEGGICNYLNTQSNPHISVTTYELFHQPDEEDPIDWNQELVGQRSLMYRLEFYDKPLVNAQPAKFVYGFHGLTDKPKNLDDRLIMLHMQKIDYDYFIQKGEWKSRQNLHMDVTHRGLGFQHKFSGDVLVQSYWTPTIDMLDKFREIGDEMYATAAAQFKGNNLKYCLDQT